MPNIYSLFEDFLKIVLFSKKLKAFFKKLAIYEKKIVRNL